MIRTIPTMSGSAQASSHCGTERWKMGEVPVTTNAKDALAAAPDPAYATFQFNLVQQAPAFTQSWDQALGFKIATPMLAELQKLFNGQQTPQQFVAAAAALK
jgi:xylobiose transport system substrate-binding protein